MGTPTREGSSLTPHTCPEWDEGIEKIDRIFRVSAYQGKPYTGPRFHYCPWCGKKLKRDKPEKEPHDGAPQSQPRADRLV